MAIPIASISVSQVRACLQDLEDDVERHHEKHQGPTPERNLADQSPKRGSALEDEHGRRA